MTLALTILTETGTFGNGRPRLAAEIIHLSLSSGFTRDLVDLAKLGPDYDLLEGDVDMIEIDPAGLLALNVEPDLNMINGQDFDGYASSVAELRRAQDALRRDGVRAMISCDL